MCCADRKVAAMLLRHCGEQWEWIGKFRSKETEGYYLNSTGSFCRDKSHFVQTLQHLNSRKCFFCPFTRVFTLSHINASILALFSVNASFSFSSFNRQPFCDKLLPVPPSPLLCFSLQGDEVMTVIKTKAQWPAWQPLNL